MKSPLFSILCTIPGLLKMPFSVNRNKKCSYFERLTLQHIHDNGALKREYSFTGLLKTSWPMANRTCESYYFIAVTIPIFNKAGGIYKRIFCELSSHAGIWSLQGWYFVPLVAFLRQRQYRYSQEWQTVNSSSCFHLPSSVIMGIHCHTWLMDTALRNIHLQPFRASECYKRGFVVLLCSLSLH